MTTYNINQNIQSNKFIPRISSVRFDYLGQKVYGAKTVEKLTGVFLTQPILGPDALIRWNSVSWSGLASPTFFISINFFIKSASTLEELEIAQWSPPLKNGENIEGYSGKYMQIMSVLTNSYLSTTFNTLPRLNSLQVSYLSEQSASRFFTKTFNIGFAPKSVILTHNSDVTDDAILRWAITGFDSANPDDYFYIQANKLNDLSGITNITNQLKIMVEMIGDSTTPITIHEFGMMFDRNNCEDEDYRGEDFRTVDENPDLFETGSSSSSSSSSSQTSMSSSSSSSIDSSSSSSSSIDSSSSST